DFWYTSWIDAGKPDLKDLLKSSFTKADKKKIKHERRMYEKGKLLEENLLISKKVAVTEN
ncbi:MAG: hypothetical protein M3352_02560, partial [Bacteroidota bacterium]|nr:hypothetical protein [Bacteroidota bacterium]